MQVGEVQSNLLLWDVVEIEKELFQGFTNYGTSVARLLIMKKLEVAMHDIRKIKVL